MELELIWPLDYIAIGMAVFFVIGVYVFAFWPRKRDEEINSPHDRDELVRSSEAEYFGDIEGVEISKFSGPTNLEVEYEQVPATREPASGAPQG